MTLRAERCRFCGQEHHRHLKTCADAEEVALCLDLKGQRATYVPAYIKRERAS